jgi:hypothetical protein
MEKDVKHKEKTRILIFIILIGCIAATLVKPVAQDINYHLFADDRTILSIPNFWNVVSNIPLILIGGAGILFFLYHHKNKTFTSPTLNYFIFFFGVFLAGFGSIYYHLHPNNETLVWDRLPMTIAFMSFFSIIISEYIDERKGKLLLLPLLLIGAESVLYWQYTESIGKGDLRAYAMVQFFPMLLITLIMILFKSNNKYAYYIWLMLPAYVFAKIFESCDVFMFHSVNVLSGHTLKHFTAALAPTFFLMGIHKRYLSEKK